MKNNMPIKIEPGYLVIFQEKDSLKEYKTIVFNDSEGSTYCANEDWFFDLYEYNNLNMEDEWFKITKVYGLQKYSDVVDYNSEHIRELIYDASVKRMTKSEIEEALGYKIEIVEE